jgi:23S rRNA pseudouridine1911/1915/1917 synthase
MRLDRYVVRSCPQFSRAWVQKLFDHGLVLVNGRPVKSGDKARAGDQIEITLPPPEPSPLKGEAIPLDIIYEDADVIVVDKPAGLTMYPAAGHAEHTLLNAVLHHVPGLAESGQGLRPGVVHRLDRDTSGVVVIAKNSPAREYLIGQFKARTVKKVYLVLVQGTIHPPKGRIEAPIGRHPTNRQRMAVVERGRAASTAYAVKQYVNGHSLLEVTLETGRTHQIRVHFAAIGYPVVGDAIYGVKSPMLKRQFVHAHRLGFRLPSTGEFCEFVSPLPEDLEPAVRVLRRG